MNIQDELHPHMIEGRVVGKLLALLNTPLVVGEPDHIPTQRREYVIRISAKALESPASLNFLDRTLDQAAAYFAQHLRDGEKPISPDKTYTRSGIIHVDRYTDSETRDLKFNLWYFTAKETT